MTAIVLPDIDRSTLADLRERMPSLKLSEIELPSLEHAGREADRVIDRALGRSRPAVWPRIALGMGLVALASATVWFLTWSRRSSWTPPIDDVNPSPAPRDSTVQIDTLSFEAEDRPDLEGGRP